MLTPARPNLEGLFSAQCDDCGKEHFYDSDDVLRYEARPPSSFVAHPLFSETPHPRKGSSSSITSSDGLETGGNEMSKVDTQPCPEAGA